MDIEGFAVHAVEGVLLKCSRIKANIEKGDRVPLTDGHIDVYSSPSLTNENMLGRVAVQVKGRSVSKDYKFKEIESFQLERSTLEGYLHSKGVLFFLVLINKKKTNIRKAYHALLTPFKIQHLLDEMPDGQATKTIHLRRFPKRTEEMEPILSLAIQAQEEMPSLGFDPALFDVAEELTLYSDTQLTLERPISLNYEDLNFSLRLRTTSGMSVPIPGEMMIYPADYMERPTDLTFQSGNFTFRNPTVRRLDEERNEFILSEGLKLDVPNSGSGAGGNIHLSLRDSLGGRHSDIGFFLACMDQGSYSVNGHVLRFEAPPMHHSDEIRDHFEYLDQITVLFAGLDADPDLVNVSDISEQRSQQLGGLYQAVIEKKEFVEELDAPSRILQPIGPWYLELMCIQGDTPGKWKYQSLFSKDLARQFFFVKDEEADDASISRITQFDIVDEKRFARTLNLNLDRVVEAYSEIFEYPETATRANHMVLRLIKAADSLPLRRSEFLDAASRLNEWLIETEGERPHHLINRWQILDRRNILTDAHRAQIRALRRTAAAADVDLPLQVAFSCSVLIGDHEEADDYYAALEKDAQETLRGWPIWTLRTSRPELLER